ncbi:virulence associated protein C, VapC [Candidatus Brocadia pituitae]|nr:virulence associated protein C, VapC [Candidatus Brocadia pituitae]
MNKFVVDASVAIKWYLPENFSEDADRLLNPFFELLVPELLFAETGNILWKLVMKSECPYGKAVKITRAIETMPFQIWDTRILAEDALNLACRVKRTFYDSLYLSLAVRNACQMFTADLKLYHAIKRTPFKGYVLWVEDIP